MVIRGGLACSCEWSMKRASLEAMAKEARCHETGSIVHSCSGSGSHPSCAQGSSFRPDAIADGKDQRLRRLHQPPLGALLQLSPALFRMGRRPARPARSGSSTALTRSTTHRLAAKPSRRPTHSSRATQASKPRPQPMRTLSDANHCSRRQTTTTNGRTTRTTGWPRARPCIPA